jgi:hypothetical protein
MIHGWSAFGGADHGWQSFGLERRAWTLARKLAWAVGIPRHLKAYPADVQMIWPVARRGRPRQRHIPNILSMPAGDMLADVTWQNISCVTRAQARLFRFHGRWL